MKKRERRTREKTVSRQCKIKSQGGKIVKVSGLDVRYGRRGGGERREQFSQKITPTSNRGKANVLVLNQTKKRKRARRKKKGG